MSGLNIAVDGPAGAGKSTISKLLAKDLGLVYIDTGAMYRAVALKMLRAGVDVKQDAVAVERILGDTDIDIRHAPDGQRIFLDGEDVTGKIRTPQVSVMASDVAVIPAVRLKLVALQRALAQKSDCIMDGRDIGTYVLPNASLKLFLTASAEDRAKRRFDELLARGESVTYEAVLRDLKYRDKNDSTREMAPLKPAADSVLVDTTGNTFEQSVGLLKNIILNHIKETKSCYIDS